MDRAGPQSASIPSSLAREFQLLLGGSTGEGGLLALSRCETPSASEMGMVRIFLLRLLPFQLLQWMCRKRAPKAVDRGGSFLKNVALLGGPERVSAILRMAKLDPNLSGNITQAELAAFEGQAGAFVQQVVSNCQTMSVVGTLVMGLTHNNSIGRPAPWSASKDLIEAYGEDAADGLMWMTYLSNVSAELLAITLLLMCISTRSMLVSILPTLPAKLRFIHNANPQGVIHMVLTSTILCLWMVVIFGGLLQSPRWGWLALGATVAFPTAYSAFMAPHYFDALCELHREVKLTVRLHETQKQRGKFAASGTQLHLEKFLQQQPAGDPALQAAQDLAAQDM